MNPSRLREGAAQVKGKMVNAMQAESAAPKIPGTTDEWNALLRIRALYSLLGDANALISQCSVEELGEQKSADSVLTTLYGRLCERATYIDTKILLAWVGRLDVGSSDIQVVASAGAARAYADSIHIHVDLERPENNGPTGRAIAQQRAVICNDFIHDPSTVPWHEKAKQFGIAASISIPLLDQGRAIGALMFYSGDVNAFDATLSDLLVGLGRSLSHLISERRGFVRQLKQSRIDLQAILDAGDETIAMIEHDGRVIAINHTGAARLNASPEALVGRDLFSFLPPDVAATRRATVEQAFESGKAISFSDSRNGRHFNTRLYPVLDGTPRMVIYAIDITDQVDAKKALSDSEQRYRALFEYSHSVMLIIDPADGAITDCNMAACLFYGLPSEQLRAMNISDINALSAQEVAAEMALSTSEHRNHLRFKHRLADGRLRDVEVYSGPINIEERPLLYAIVIDVTEQRRNTRRIEALLELSVIDRDQSEADILNHGLALAERVTNSKIGFLHFVNTDQETIELVTWTAGALKGCTAAHDNHYPISQAGIWADCFRTRAPAIFNDYPGYAQKRGLPEGHAHLQRLISVPVIDDGLIRMMIGVGNKPDDYSDADIETVQLIGNDLWRIVRHERAERSLRDAIKVVETSPVISFRWAAIEPWSVEYVSNNISLWGYTPEQLCAGKPAYAELVHPDDREHAAQQIANNLARNNDQFHMEYRIAQADGEYFWVDNHIRLIRDGAGVPLRYEGVVANIDVRKRAEESMFAALTQQRELNKKLESVQTQLLQSEKMASIGQLAAGVAHELNNPIGFVHSNLGTLQTYISDLFQIMDAYAAAEKDLATKHPAIDAAIQLKATTDFDFLRGDIDQLIAESRDGMNRVKKIVQDLRDFSRVGETDWQWANLHTGLDSTLNIVWNELKYTCTIQKNYAADLPQIHCVPSQLNQVFMNLLVNASHAIEGKGEITITTACIEPASVEVIISDTGKGILPEHLPHIFEPFFTTKPVGKGTGLGLSIVYGIIGKHHGNIDVKSTPGKGTSFHIVLPIDPAVTMPSIGATESASTSISSAVTPTPTLTSP